MAILDFSVSGWHGFGSVIQVCFGISVSNFMCMSFVAVGRSLMIVSYVTFKMAALWFWTMFNCNPPIAHCHPLLWGGGILVDHWSTISSFILFLNTIFMVIKYPSLSIFSKLWYLVTLLWLSIFHNHLDIYVLQTCNNCSDINQNQCIQYISLVFFSAFSSVKDYQCCVK